MGILGRILGSIGSDHNSAVSARKAYHLALQSLEDWGGFDAVSAELCCVYSASDDSGRTIGKRGDSRAWHFDFMLDNQEALFLVRVVDGKAVGWEKPIHETPVEYTYVIYAGDEARHCPQPQSIPRDWIDTNIAVRSATTLLESEMDDLDQAVLSEFSTQCICYPASYIRYLHPRLEPEIFAGAPPDGPCCAVMMSHPDTENHDSIIVYLDSKTGDSIGFERFRCPEGTHAEISCQW